MAAARAHETERQNATGVLGCRYACTRAFAAPRNAALPIPQPADPRPRVTARCAARRASDLYGNDDDRPALGIVVEAQLAIDDRKRYAWPVYVAGLRARMRCPVCLFVVTPNEAVARWASKEIDLGGGSCLRPHVLGPSGVPEIIDDVLSKSDPELAVLSVMAHGRDADSNKAAHIAKAALAATEDLDDHRRQLYVDWVFASLSEAAGRSLQAMKPFKFEYQSNFARKYFAAGAAAGEAQGRAAVLLKQLQLKFGALPEPVIDRVRSAGVDELDIWAERILSAAALDDVLR